MERPERRERPEQREPPEHPDRLPVRAAAGDLPPAVAGALRDALASAVTLPERTVEVQLAGLRFRALEWGSGTPLLLLHGITASSHTWWRIGPALAATGRRVVAPDLPGHGATDAPAAGPGRAHFAITAGQVAAFARAAGLAPEGPEASDLDVVGHSWGAMVAAHLPDAGLRPGRIVLLDPPVVPYATLRARVEVPDEPVDLPPEGIRAAIERGYPTWPAPDRWAKAKGLIECDRDFVVEVTLSNGSWDAGLAALSSREAAGVPVAIVRADPAAGGVLPDEVAAAFERLLGPGSVVTLAGADHSPQRLFPEATTRALLRALDRA